MAKVLVKFDRAPGTAVSVFRMAEAEGRRAMLEHWHTKFAPEHFKPSAMKRYGYQPRQGDNEGPYLQVSSIDPRTGKLRTRTVPNWHYSWKKRKLKGHNNPLVFSGNSQDDALEPSGFEVDQLSANRSRGKFVSLPSYFYKYLKPGVVRNRRGEVKAVITRQQPDKGKELTTVRNDEVAEMARVGEQRVVAFLNAFRAPTTSAA